MGDTRFLFNGLINERKSRPRKKLRSRTTFHPLVSPLASLLPFPFFSIFFFFFPFLFSLSLFFFAQPLLLMNPRPSPNLPPLLLLTFFHRSPYAVFDRNYFHLPIQLSIHLSICPAIETKNEIARERERDYFNPNDGCERARMEEPKEWLDEGEKHGAQTEGKISS